MAASSVYNVQRMDYGYSTFIDVKGLRVGELVRLTANMSIINEDFFKLPYTALKIYVPVRGATADLQGSIRDTFYTYAVTQGQEDESS